MTLIWTRSKEDWEQDRAFFKDPKKVLHLPCITIAPLNISARPTFGTKYVIVTSQNALKFALRNPNLRTIIFDAEAVFTFGQETTQLCHSVGLRNVVRISAAHSSEELCKSVSQFLAPESPLMIIQALFPAFNSGSYLSSLGLDVTVVPVYKTESRCRVRLSPAKLRALKGIVCFASPSAVEGFTTAIRNPKKLKTLTAVVIGPTTAKACGKQFKGIKIAKQARIESLIQLAEKLE